MTYTDKEKEAIIATQLKNVVPEGWEYSLSVHSEGYSGFVCTAIITIWAASVDLMTEINNKRGERPGEENLIRTYGEFHTYYEFNRVFGESLPIIEKIVSALEISGDLKQALYGQVNIGARDKPFIYKATYCNNI